MSSTVQRPYRRGKHYKRQLPNDSVPHFGILLVRHLPDEAEKVEQDKLKRMEIYQDQFERFGKLDFNDPRLWQDKASVSVNPTEPRDGTECEPCETEPEWEEDALCA